MFECLRLGAAALVPSRWLEQRDHYSFRRPALAPSRGEEVRAVRERAGLIDISAFTKIEVSAPDGHAFSTGLWRTGCRRSLAESRWRIC